MYFLLLGLALLGLKLAGVDPVTACPWWAVLAPFGLAIAWWAFADRTGYYKRREMRKLAEKTAARREHHIQALKPRGKSGRSR